MKFPENQCTYIILTLRICISILHYFFFIIYSSKRSTIYHFILCYSLLSINIYSLKIHKGKTGHSEQTLQAQQSGYFSISKSEKSQFLLQSQKQKSFRLARDSSPPPGRKIIDNSFPANSNKSLSLFYTSEIIIIPGSRRRETSSPRP